MYFSVIYIGLSDKLISDWGSIIYYSGDNWREDIISMSSTCHCWLRSSWLPPHDYQQLTTTSANLQPPPPPPPCSEKWAKEPSDTPWSVLLSSHLLFFTRTSVRKEKWRWRGRHRLVAGGCLRGWAVQRQPRRGMPPRRGGRVRGRGRPVDAVRRRRVQPLGDRFPRPWLLRGSRRNPAIPPPMVHSGHRGILAPHTSRPQIPEPPLTTSIDLNFWTCRFAQLPTLTHHFIQVDLCGHATLASAHFLFTTVLPEHGKLEFMTRSGMIDAVNVLTQYIKQLNRTCIYLISYINKMR